MQQTDLLVVTGEYVSVEGALALLDMEIATCPSRTLVVPGGTVEWPADDIVRVYLSGITQRAIGVLLEKIDDKYNTPGHTVLPIREVQIDRVTGEILLSLDKKRISEMSPQLVPPDD
jgi:hypothetical protein